MSVVRDLQPSLGWTSSQQECFMTRHTGGTRCSPSQVDHGDTKGFGEPVNVEGLLEESGTSLNELS